jgi:hypothetical protein
MGPLVAAPVIQGAMTTGAAGAAGTGGLTMSQVGAAGLGMQGLGMGIEGLRSKKQYKRSKKQMEKQFRLQQKLNQQGFNLSHKMWEMTNYPAQIEQMKKAGLNPALMYGQAGQGGTTNSGSGGSASGGAAPVMPGVDMNNMLMGAQFTKLMAEAKLTEERAENEATGVRNKLVAEFKNIMADTDFKEQVKKTEVSKTEYAKYEAAIKGRTNEWGKKYNLSPEDSAAIKTLLRTKGILSDEFDVPTNEEIKAAHEALIEYNNEEGKIYDYDNRLRE